MCVSRRRGVVPHQAVSRCAAATRVGLTTIVVATARPQGQADERETMVEVRRFIAAEPKKVFDVLTDGWQYANWVVGAAHIRAVDREWPAVGARIHHKLGPWPVQMADVTRVLK